MYMELETKISKLVKEIESARTRWRAGKEELKTTSIDKKITSGVLKILRLEFTENLHLCSLGLSKTRTHT